MSPRVFRWLAACGLALALPALAGAQPPVRLFSAGTSGTLDAANDTIELATGGLASLSIQTLDSYSGTWEVQCSLDGGTTYDTDDEVPITLVGATSTVASVTDTVGIWQANVAGCTHVRVFATAWTSGDVAVRMQAVSSGGGSTAGGTSSNFGAAVPAAGTAIGVSDGTNMQAPRGSDLDSGAGTEYVAHTSLRIAASGGSIPITAGAGAVAAGTPRVTLASDDPAVASLAIIDNIVSGSGVNVSQINGVAPLMGAGNTGTGSPRVTIATDQAALAGLGIYAEDAGETAGGNLAMSGSVRRDTAASSAGTTGDNATLNTDSLGQLWARFNDPCSGVAKQYLPIDIVTATTTEITASLAGVSTHYYICSVALVTAGANNVAIVDDDSDGCLTPTAGVMGGVTAGEGFNLAANGGLTLGNGLGSIARTNGTNRVLCIITSAAVQLSGTITVVAAP